MKNKKAPLPIAHAWRDLLLAAALYFVVAALFLRVVPKIGYPHTSISALTPGRFHEIIALLLVAGVNTVFFAYFRAKFFFSTRWLTAAVIFSNLILFVKFTLSSDSYIGEHAASFNAVLTTGLLVSALYVAIFGLIYLFFDGKILNKDLHKALLMNNQGKALLTVGLFVCATFVRIVAFRLPVISSTTASSYLTDVFKTNNTLLSALLFVMIFAAVESFAQVRRSIDLKYFFVVGSLVIVEMHVLWALFVYRGF